MHGGDAPSQGIGVVDGEIEILEAADPQETAVHRSFCRPGNFVEAAVLAPVSRQVAAQLRGDLRVAARRRQRGPAARKTRQMHQIQGLAVAEALKVGAKQIERRLLLQRDQSLDGKDRVVQVTLTRSIAGAAVLVELLPQVGGDRLTSLLEQPRREPGGSWRATR